MNGPGASWQQTPANWQPTPGNWQATPGGWQQVPAGWQLTPAGWQYVGQPYGQVPYGQAYQQPQYQQPGYEPAPEIHEPASRLTTLDTPAWLVSLVVHLSVLVVLATVWVAIPKEEVQLTVTTAIEPEKEEEQVQEYQQFRFSKEWRPEIGSPEVAGIEIPNSTAPTVSEVTEIPTERNPTEIAMVDAPSAMDLMAAPKFSNTMMFKGAAGVGAVGAVGAVDRITQEILLSLEQRKTLVVWFFDQSGSMQAQREQINRRFNRIYEELGVSKQVGGRKNEQPLLTSVIAFGKEVKFLVPNPTDNLDEIQKAIGEIKNDDSGEEQVFTAVTMAARKYETFRTQSPQRNIMFVIFSDEVGDDESQADLAIAVCRRNAIPVYVVGVPAPFGRRDIEVKYVDPDPKFDQSVQWIPVRMGPETLMPEGVQLGFVGRTDRFQDEMYRLDSGFGPYTLTRLCYESGGIYFAVHANRPEQGGYVANRETPVMSARLNYFFDPIIMRSYVPDYMPAKEYERSVLQNKAKMALLQASQKSMVMQMDQPQTRFAKLGEDEAQLKRQLDEAQKAAAILEPRINDLYQTLKLGEPDRSKLTQPRWQAGYDLAMGRVMAIKARTEAYNGMLAKAKNGMKFSNEKNNTWILVAADEISVGSALEKVAKQARDYLDRVIKDHPGTPWALLAETERKEPIGWKWTESFTPPPPPPAPATAAPANNNATPPRPAMPRPPADPPKPKRQNIKL